MTSGENIIELVERLPVSLLTRADESTIAARTEQGSLEYEIELLQRLFEARMNRLLVKFPVTKVDIGEDKTKATYYMQDGSLGIENRQLLHEVVLVIKGEQDIIGGMIVEGGNYRMLEEGKIITVPQSGGERLELEQLDPTKPCKIEGARIKKISLKKGTRLTGNESGVAFFPAGLK